MSYDRVPHYEPCHTEQQYCKPTAYRLTIKRSSKHSPNPMRKNGCSERATNKKYNTHMFPNNTSVTDKQHQCQK